MTDMIAKITFTDPDESDNIIDKTEQIDGELFDLIEDWRTRAATRPDRSAALDIGQCADELERVVEDAD